VRRDEACIDSELVITERLAECDIFIGISRDLYNNVKDVKECIFIFASLDTANYRYFIKILIKIFCLIFSEFLQIETFFDRFQNLK